MLAKAELEGRTKGVSICRGAPRVSNLLFADDSLLFCQAILNEGQVIMEILQTYTKASGQCINSEKSSVYFSRNTIGSQRQQILQILGVKEVERFEILLRVANIDWKSQVSYFFLFKRPNLEEAARMERYVVI